LIAITKTSSASFPHCLFTEEVEDKFKESSEYKDSAETDKEDEKDEDVIEHYASQGNGPCACCLDAAAPLVCAGTARLLAL
jgi:hypothetical protein